MTLSQSEEEALQVARATAKVLRLERDRLFDITEKQTAEINQLHNELDHTNKINDHELLHDNIIKLLIDERCKCIMFIEKLKSVANDPDWQSKGLEHDFDWYMERSKEEIDMELEKYVNATTNKV